MDNIAMGFASKWRPGHTGDERERKILGLVDSVTGVVGDIMSKRKGASGGTTVPQALTNQQRNQGFQNIFNAGSNTLTSNDIVRPAMSNMDAKAMQGYGENTFGFGGMAQGLSKASGASGLSYGQMGQMVNQTNKAIGNMVGNVYGDKHDKWTDTVRSIAYGDSTDNGLFATKTNKNVKGFTNDLTHKGLFNSNANTSSGVMNDISNKLDFSNNVKGVGAGRKIAGSLLASNRGAGSGAEIGGKIGDAIQNPYAGAIATIAGTAIGGLVGLGRGIAGAIRGDRNMRRINSAIDYRNNYNEMSANDRLRNMGRRGNMLADANYSAFGGEVNNLKGVSDAIYEYRQKKKRNVYADGGKVSNAKNQFRTGITEFNAGGSHEENKHGGIPQGVDGEGVPNLVEEGEVKIGDIIGKENQYILSNRLMLDEETANEFNIDPKLVGMTFASAFKKAYAPLKETPNDPISRNELASLCNAFQGAQEMLKQKQEMQEKLAMLQSIPPEVLQGLMQQEQQMAPQEAMPQEQMGGMPQDPSMMQQDPGIMQPEGQMPDPSMMQQQMPGAGEMASPDMASPEMMQQAGMPMMARGGRINRFANGGKVNRFDDKGDMETKTYEERKNETVARINDVRARMLQPLARWVKSHPDLITDNGDGTYTVKGRNGALDRTNVSQAEVMMMLYQSGEDKQFNDMMDYANLMQQNQQAEDVMHNGGAERANIEKNLKYAPVINSLNTLFNKDNYFNADKYNANYFKAINDLHNDPKQIAGKMRSQMIDPRAFTAPIHSTGAGVVSNAGRYSGGNQGNAQAAAMTGAYNTFNALGDAHLKARMYNNELRAKDAAYNSAIDQFNAQAINQVNATNDGIRTGLRDKIAETQASIDQANKETKQSAWDNLAANFANIGKEADNKLDLLSMLSQTNGYGLDAATAFNNRTNRGTKQTR